MHLGIDARALCEPRPTGIPRYAHKIINALIEQNPGLACSFFISGTKAEQHARVLSKKYPSVQCIPIAIPNKLLRAGFLSGAIALDRLLPEPDIWFLPGFKPITIRNKPFLVTVHDLSFVSHPDFWSWRRKLEHLTTQPRRISQKANHLIAVSNYTAQDLQTFFHIPKNNITVIHPGIAPITPNRQPNPNSILMLSAIEPRKNMEAAVRAIARLRTKKEFSELQLTIVGPAGWKTKRMVRELSRMDWVEMKGYVEDDELETLFAHASVFLYPSFYEGFGFPPLEAMARGVPVIASHASALPEVLGNAALYINPYDWHELADTIEQVVKDVELQRTLSVRGIERSMQYSWEKSAKQTMRVIEQVLTKKPQVN